MAQPEGDPEEKGPLWRPMHRWEDSITCDKTGWRWRGGEA